MLYVNQQQVFKNPFIDPPSTLPTHLLIAGPVASGQGGRHPSDNMMLEYVMGTWERQSTWWGDEREREAEQTSLCTMERGGTGNVKMLK